MSDWSSISFDHLKSLYFLGIGGIGMSALARYFQQRGISIYGYDRTETALTKKLVAEGMQIHYTPDPESIPTDIDLIVYTPAVPASNTEWEALRASGKPILKRAEVLGLISRNSRTIAVAGTHGKTSTSTMLTHLLRSTGIDCTAFLGGIALNFQSNYIEGKSDWVVVEADEYDRSFLHLRPELAAIMSTDPDHLDIYGDHGKMLEGGFGAFAQLVEKGLFLEQSALPEFSGKVKVFRFGLEKGDYRATNIRVEEGAFVFDFEFPEGVLKELRTTMPGRHNIENATAAIALALNAGADPDLIRNGLLEFRGIKRRFERIFEGKRIVYIDDYAHHPTELKAAIRAAKELFPNRKITGIFQPHLFSRTRDFSNGFAEALDELDEAVVLDIYPAREEAIPGVDSEMILRQMKLDKKEIQTKASLIDALKQKQIDVLLTLGAGDIDTLVEPISQYLREQER
ncbi:MAG: UDP-N-acetylmuramate--L-alanine ligase [Saprospiraceae bacterium]|nr:UDP-N-acetylmuramate--L-alanine ligase [Saprospiraceae bacterium]